MDWKYKYAEYQVHRITKDGLKTADNWQATEVKDQKGKEKIDKDRFKIQTQNIRLIQMARKYKYRIDRDGLKIQICRVPRIQNEYRWIENCG